MPAKSYYVVLGVSRDELPAGIRTAYHELARRSGRASSLRPSRAEAFPIKASDKPSTWICKRCGVKEDPYRWEEVVR